MTLSFFPITVPPLGAMTSSSRTIAPTITPFGNLDSFSDLFTRTDVSNASASITSPKSSRTEYMPLIRPRRTCCRIEETVMTLGLTTASIPRVVINCPYECLLINAIVLFAPALFANSYPIIFTSSSFDTATNVSVFPT